VIAYFDYLPEYRRLKDEIDAAVMGVLSSGRLILGPQVESFEREFARYCGTAAAVGVASGTDSMILALKALGIGEGDEVLTVANAGVPPVAAIRSAGASPRFADVDAESMNVDVDSLEAALTSRTRCILPVHLYGRPAPIDEIIELAQAHDLPVIEDCSHAHGGAYLGRHVGSFGRIGCFSFYPTKNLGAYGDGGICITQDGEMESKLRRLRMYGLEEGLGAGSDGMNSRLDELQAAILRVKLRHLDESVAERRRLAELYLERLAGTKYQLQGAPPGSAHAYHLFVIRCDDREAAIGRLEAAGIGHAVHYPIPVHLMPAYEGLGYAEGDLPATEVACREVLSLPLYAGLEPEAVEAVSEALSRS
jgi:dTDP-4-amino-4,6-dideoxygalactose transaminase